MFEEIFKKLFNKFRGFHIFDRIAIYKHLKKVCSCLSFPLEETAPPPPSWGLVGNYRGGVRRVGGVKGEGCGSYPFLSTKFNVFTYSTYFKPIFPVFSAPKCDRFGEPILWLKLVEFVVKSVTRSKMTIYQILFTQLISYAVLNQ